MFLVKIRSDHGEEFQNENFISFCEKYGLEHDFPLPRTPQQNEVVEMKTMTIQEIARTISNKNALPK